MWEGGDKSIQPEIFKFHHVHLLWVKMGPFSMLPKAESHVVLVPELLLEPLR